MFQIKICGVTSVKDALLAEKAGAEALGINFYPKSARCVSDSIATDISQALSPGTLKVGLFVNENAARIRQLIEKCQLDWVQLHGDEPAEFLCELPKNTLVLRAWRLKTVPQEAIQALTRYLEACQTYGRLPDALLLDAYSPTEYGGTGKELCWKSLKNLSKLPVSLPLVLAGGLTPENVATAVFEAGAAFSAVDTASGVESAPGIKNAEKMNNFVISARSAFENPRKLYDS